MEYLQPSRSITRDYEEFPGEQRRLLEQSVEKVVRIAQQVGVTPEDMILLLDSGFSIRELLAFLASKTSGVA